MTPGSFFYFVFFSILFLSVEGSAFNLTNDFKEGFYWQEFPIHLSVVDDSSFEYQKIVDLEWALDRALEEWDQKIPQLGLWRIDASVAPNTASRNIVKWERNFQAVTGLVGAQYLAVTIRRAVIPLIARVEILMNTEYLNIERSDLVKVLVHELGHTIGLDHSDDASSIMSAAIRLGPYSNQSIKLDDISGISYIFTEMGFRQAGTSLDPAYRELSSREQNSGKQLIPSCATIEDINKDGGGGGGSSFLMSFAFGLFLMLLFGKNFHHTLLEIID